MDVFSVFSHEGTSFREIFLRDLFARPAKTTADQITALALILSRSSMAALCPSEVATALSAAWCAGGYGFKPAAFISCNKDTAWNQTSKIQRWRRQGKPRLAAGSAYSLAATNRGPRFVVTRRSSHGLHKLTIKNTNASPLPLHQKPEANLRGCASNSLRRLSTFRPLAFLSVVALAQAPMAVAYVTSVGLMPFACFRGGGGGTGSRGKPRIYFWFTAPVSKERGKTDVCTTTALSPSQSLFSPSHVATSTTH